MNKQYLNGLLISRALTLGIPKESKAKDFVDSNKTNVEKTIKIKTKEEQLNYIIERELEKYNLNNDEKLRIKSLLQDEKFKEKYSELLNGYNNILSIDNILSILILLTIGGLGFNHIRNKNKESLLVKLKATFDLAPIPISAYSNDGYPEIWNKQLEKEFGYTHQQLIDYFEEIIEKTDDSGIKRFEKRGEITTLIYKNTKDHKDLDNVNEYLKLLESIHKDGYSNIPFTGTTSWGERKTFLWTTRPKKGGTIRFAIPKDQKVEELEELLRKDILTGAYSLRSLKEDLHNLLVNINRPLDPKKYTICLIDLDNFKDINDKYGHVPGDAILKNFAQHIILNIRGGDKLYRIGGDEFILILDSEKNDDLIFKLNHIRKTFWNKLFITEGGYEIQTGSSWGLQELNISDYHNPNLDKEETTNIFDSLRNKMDEYLYCVKYYRNIEKELIESGRIQEDYKEKNSIANVVFNKSGALEGIDIIGNDTKFTLTEEEVRTIQDITRSKKNLREKKKVKTNLRS